MSNFNFNSMTILDSTGNENHITLTNMSGKLTTDSEIAQGDYTVTVPLNGTNPYPISIKSDIITDDGVFLVETTLNGKMVASDDTTINFHQTNKAIISKTGNTIQNFQAEIPSIVQVGTFTLTNDITGEFTERSHDLGDGTWSDAYTLSYPLVDNFKLDYITKEDVPQHLVTITSDTTFSLSVPFGETVNIQKLDIVSNPEPTKIYHTLVEADISGSVLNLDVICTGLTEENCTQVKLFKRTTAFMGTVIYSDEIILENITFTAIDDITCDLPSGVALGDNIVITINDTTSTSKTFDVETEKSVNCVVDVLLGDSKEGTRNNDFYLTVTQGEVNQLLDVTTNYTMKITPLG